MGAKIKSNKQDSRESRNRSVLSKTNGYNTGNNTPRSIERQNTYTNPKSDRIEFNEN
jgi:hypothetical protein